MYNLYVYEKRKQKAEEEKEKKRKELLIEQKHKEKIKELNTNYSQRIKKFIFRMVEDPVQLNNFKSHILDPYISSSYCFRNLQPEREILQELNKSNENPMQPKKIPKYSGPSLIQPNMHFKARNDNERIADSIYQNRGIDEEEDKKMKDTEQMRKDEMLKQKMEEIKEIEKRRKEENLKIMRRRRFRPSPLKFTQSFAQKTFFKATNQVLLNHLDDKNVDLSKEVNKKMEKEYGNTLITFKGKYLPNIKKSASAENIYLNRYSNMTGYNLDTDKMSKDANMNIINEIRDDPNKELKTFYDFEIDKENEKNFPKNPYKLKAFKGKINPESMLYLRNLSKRSNLVYDFGNPQENKSVSQNKSRLTSEEVMDEIKHKRHNRKSIDNLYDKLKSSGGYEFLRVGDEIFRKDDVKNITHKVLEHCGFTKPKFDPNEEFQRKGQGKLMVTNGLTLTNFLAKYGLPNFVSDEYSHS